MSRRLEQALSRRGDRCAANDDVCRLVAGESDGLPGLVIDRIGAYAFATCHGPLSPELRSSLEAVVARCWLRGLTLRRRGQGGRGEELLALGEPVPEGLTIQEGPVRVQLRIQQQSLSYGIFPDLRPERLRVGAEARGLRVLNLYAYSGLFGIHAAHGGAAEVVQVDALKSMLAMIRANEALNDVETRCICEDALRYCQRLARRGQQFDLVIHDPPTFGRTPKGKPRSTVKAMGEMLEATMAVVAPGGRLLSVINTASIGEKRVAAAHREAAKRMGRGLRKLRGLELADDAPGPLKGGWFRID